MMGSFNVGVAKLILLGAVVAMAAPASAASITVNANAGHHPNINSSATIYTDQHGIASRLPTSGFAGDLVRTDNGVSTYAPGSLQPRWETSASEAASSAKAYGDLSTGQVGAYAATSAAGFATASAAISDTLTFNIAGADANTITPLRFLISLHAATPNANSVFQFGAGGNFTIIGALNNPGYMDSRGWSQSRTWVEDSTRYFDLTYDLRGANPVLGIGMTLEALADLGSISDFYHTAGVQLQASQGATYTSESGVFLAAAGAGAVPEPATWAMMIVGFGAAGSLLRHRRMLRA